MPDTQEKRLGHEQLGGCSICPSAPMWNGKLAICGRPTFHHIANGIHEVCVRCKWPDGVTCFRSLGLFITADDIPDWIFDLG